MLKKLFNKKMITVYVIILCLSFVSASVSLGFAISSSAKYNKEIEAIKKAESSTSSLDATQEAALEIIMNALAASNGSINKTSSQKITLSDEAKAFKSAQKTYTVLTVILYILFALSLAASVTCSEYDKYLNSEKYKAKLKRMKKHNTKTN